MKLSKFFGFYFLASFATLFLSGMGWWGLHEIAWLHVHGVSSHFFMLGMGYLIHSHVRPGLRLSRRMVSGLMMLGVTAILAGTAFPLLYAGEGAVRDVSIRVHTYLGLGVPLFFGAHYFAGVVAGLVRVPSMTKAHA